MSTVQTVGAGAAAGAAVTASKASAADSQERFLRLLITQLKNQDPLNPLDNAQMTSQLAQISSIERLEQLNRTLESMAAKSAGSQAVQAAELVGREVMIAGSELDLAGGVARAGIDLPQSVEQITVTIRDGSGAVVHRADLGAHPQGLVRIEWDGLTDSGTAAAEGRYQFSVSARAGGAEVAVEPMKIGRVIGVRSGTEGTSLDLGVLGGADLAQVRRIF